MKIVFIGTPEFGAIILEKLINNNYKLALVVTETDKPVGRKHIVTPPPVKVIAEKHHIPVVQPGKIANLISDIKNLKPDLIIVAAYGQIIPKEILEIPQYGCLNVHPSLLPKYRGPSPIQTAILNGDEATGVTIMLLDDKMDHGPIIAQRELEFPIHNFQFSNLHDKLAELGAKLLIDIIPKWVSGRIKPIPQDEKMATYTKILKKEDGKIDWTKSAKVIERQIRALSPWPGAYTQIKDGQIKIKMIKIWKARMKEQTANGPFGVCGKTFIATNGQIAVQTGKDFLIIEELQLEGAKRMSSSAFIAGRQDFIGAIFT